MAELLFHPLAPRPLETLVPHQLRHAPALADGSHRGRGRLRALPVRHRGPAAVYLLPVLMYMNRTKFHL